MHRRMNRAGMIQFLAIALASMAHVAAAQESTNLSLPTDRTLGTKFDQLPGLIQNGQFNEVTRFLGGLLGGESEAAEPQDVFFLPENRKERPLGLKAEARRILGSLPPAGRSAYQLQFGARAEKLLTAAISSGDTADLEAVSRRYFHTDAGYQATFLRAVLHLDQGQPLAAAQMFQTLLDAPHAVKILEPGLSLRAATCWLWSGRPERARDILVRWKETTGVRTVEIAGQSVSVFSRPEDAVIWLSKLVGDPILPRSTPAESWAVHRGNAARNGQTLGGTPLFSTRWRVRVADDPAIEKLISGLENAARQRRVAIVPSIHPLAIGNVVVTRSARDVVGIDFETGKRLWEARPQVDDGFDRLIKAGHASVTSADDGSQLVEQLGRRMWDDAAYGNLSSDGQRVFAVQDLTLDSGQLFPQGMFFIGPQEEEPAVTSNRLTALALEGDGQSLWDAGGPKSAEPLLRDAFFLGPPLPLEGRLYALAEIKGGVRLVVLDAESGKMLWSQQLADVEFNIAQHSQRRLAGAMPSIAEGVIVCPIGAGAVVAVDLATRELKWAFRYPEREDVYSRGMFGSAYQTQLERENDRWVDNSVTIYEDKVILTPIESSRLYCLNLFDGAPVWEPKRRGDNLYVACVHNGRIILIGKEHLTALDIATGAQGWPDGMVTLPDDALPSGRGYYSGQYYYLPLSSAEVAKIDLANGKIVARVKSRDGHIPGNLICHHGMVLSQGADFLYKYFQLEPLEAWITAALEANDRDPVALLRQGQLAMERGEFASAVDLLREAHRQAAAQNASSPVVLEAREMFLQGMLEGLRVDFERHRPFLGELRSLIDQPDRLATLLRLEAAGLQKAGDTDAALKAYLQLIALDGQSSATGLETLAPGHQAQHERWLGAELSSLYATSDASVRSQMESAVAVRLDAAIESKNVNELRSALTCFYFHPRRAELTFALCDQLSDGALEAQLLLESLYAADHQDGGYAESAEARAERKAEAAARLAMIYGKAGHYEQAAAWSQKLTNQWPDVVCLAGKTGREVAESWSPEMQQRLATAATGPIWPQGEAKASIRSGAGEYLYRNSRSLEMRGTRNEYFKHITLSLDQQPPSIVGYDGFGAIKFRVPLQPNEGQHSYDVDPMTSYVSARGNLLLASIGHEVLAIDALNVKAASWQNVIWKVNLQEFPSGVRGGNFIRMKHVRVPGGPVRLRSEDGNGNPVGNIGVVGHDLVVLQRNDTLVAVQALTGEVVWTRAGVAAGCDLFGDANLLIAVPPASTEARVFRAQDGTELGSVAIASESKRVATLGRRVVVYSRAPGQNTLALTDPWSKATVWSVPLQRATQIWNVDQEYVAAMEPNGRFRLLDMATGEPLVDQQLEAEPRMDGILVLPCRDQFFLFTYYEPGPPDADTIVATVPGEPTDPPLMSGRVYAFDRSSGAPLWPVPATIDRRGLRFPQHRDLPVLVFVQNRMRKDQEDEGGQTSIVCLDKRTGRMIYRNDAIRFTPRASFDYQANGNAASGTVWISLPSSTITLKLTEQPLPPEPPEQESAQQRKKQQGRGFFGIFGSTLESMSTPAEDRGEPSGDLFDLPVEDLPGRKRGDVEEEAPPEGQE